MAERVTRMIWCARCLAENWGEVSRLIDGGRATWRSGPLRLRAWCRSCDAEMSAGSEAEAVTVHSGRPDEATWSDGYIGVEPAPRTGWEEV